MWLLPALAACASDPVETAPPARSRRGDVVLVNPDEVEPPEAFCDHWTPADQAGPFPWPPLDGPAPAANGRWTWVNVWATWCGPCVEEMPRLVQWQKDLAREGVSYDLTLVSVDEQASVMSRFLEGHDGWPPSMRMTDPAALQGWMTGLGLDAGAAIPIQAFADPEGRLRCVRTGSLAHHHLGSVRKILTGG
jgi:thiol-disulfide isomerase/thioredoxin